jgi:hypothetical protein
MKRKRLAPLALAVFTLLVTVGILNAAPDAYEISWWTVDGGGGTLNEGAYSLSGTVGQPDAGSALTRNGYTLVGGFWYGVAAPAWYDVHLPVVLRSY